MASEAHREYGSPAYAAGTVAARASLACVPWTALETEVPAWDRLARVATEPNPFFESWYLLPSLRHLPGAAGVSMLRFEQDGQLAGLLPIVRSPRY